MTGHWARPVRDVVAVDPAVARRRAARDLRRLANEVADVVDRPGWHQRAACRGQLAVMFPVSMTEQAVAPALRLCGTCEVFDECRAASAGEYNGVWAGQVRVRERRRRMRLAG